MRCLILRHDKPSFLLSCRRMRHLLINWNVKAISLESISFGKHIFEPVQRYDAHLGESC
jgi:hypothetical protein